MALIRYIAALIASAKPKRIVQNNPIKSRITGRMA